MHNATLRFAAVLGALLAGAATAAEEPRPDVAAYFEAQRAALAAYQAEDGAAFLEEAERALAANPGHPPARYLRAAALAMAARTDDALAELTALADLGLVQAPDKEPAFAAVAEEARFRAVLARYATNARPRGEARAVLRAEALPGDFVPESVARDAARERTLLGSVRQRRIAAVDAEGNVRDFVPAARDGLLSVLGMRVAGDALLVASSGFAEMRPADAARVGDSTVFAYALADGALRGQWSLRASGEVKHAIGDLLVLADGRVLVSDSLEGALYALDRRSSSFTRLNAAGTRFIGSPQGMAVLDARRVAFADYTTGLWIVDLGPPPGGDPASAHAEATATRRATTFARLGSDVPAALYGIDGLYAWRDSLVAIQNGTRPARIIKLRLDPAKQRIVDVTVLAANLPDWDEPTLGEVVGDTFHFVANSHWSKFDADGNLPPATDLPPPLIQSINLR